MCFLQQLKMNATLARIKMKHVDAKKKLRAINRHTTVSFLSELAAGLATESVL
jgi:hypothetical protein